MSEPPSPLAENSLSSLTPSIGLKLLPRDVRTEGHPGHMGVAWQSEGRCEFRGFRFKVDELPEEFRSTENWRGYLLKNKVPGYVFNDIVIQDSLTLHPSKVLCKVWPVQVADTEKMESAITLGPCGWYSFAPDQHEDCHNCVTWAISTVKRVLGEVLQSVPTGRIKVATQVLLELGATPSA